MRARHKRDPGCAIRVCVNLGPFRIRLTTVARNGVDLRCRSRLSITTRFRDDVAVNAAVANIEELDTDGGKWFDALCVCADVDAAHPHDLRMLRSILSGIFDAMPEEWIVPDTDNHGCKCSWYNVPELSAALVRKLPELRTDYSPYATANVAERGTVRYYEKERMRYVALWMNAFPTSAYTYVPTPTPVTTVEILAANRRLAAIMGRLVADAERLESELARLEPHVVEMARWPVRISSRGALCCGLRQFYLTRDDADGSTDGLWCLLAPWVSIVAQAAAEEQWWPRRKQAAARYLSFLSVLEHAVSVGADLVGRDGEALEAFCSGASPPIATDADLLEALVSGLNFQWRRPSEPRDVHRTGI